ncbi:unnamed protein product, partial [Vitis vinifera]|uniref:Uncharacterized protein n=1 Tax=Vitis vinifera TaxID=29760 RepID=D7SVA0_VITVI
MKPFTMMQSSTESSYSNSAILKKASPGPIQTHRRLLPHHHLYSLPRPRVTKQSLSQLPVAWSQA